MHRVISEVKFMNGQTEIPIKRLFYATYGPNVRKCGSLNLSQP
jgi:hypothetical protein